MYTMYISIVLPASVRFSQELKRVERLQTRYARIFSFSQLELKKGSDFIFVWKRAAVHFYSIQTGSEWLRTMKVKLRREEKPNKLYCLWFDFRFHCLSTWITLLFVFVAAVKLSLGRSVLLRAGFLLRYLRNNLQKSILYMCIYRTIKIVNPKTCTIHK